MVLLLVGRVRGSGGGGTPLQWMLPLGERLFWKPPFRRTVMIHGECDQRGP